MPTPAPADTFALVVIGILNLFQIAYTADVMRLHRRRAGFFCSTRYTWTTLLLLLTSGLISLGVAIFEAVSIAQEGSRIVDRVELFIIFSATATLFAGAGALNLSFFWIELRMASKRLKTVAGNLKLTRCMFLEVIFSIVTFGVVAGYLDWKGLDEPAAFVLLANILWGSCVLISTFQLGACWIIAIYERQAARMDRAAALMCSMNSQVREVASSEAERPAHMPRPPPHTPPRQGGPTLPALPLATPEGTTLEKRPPSTTEASGGRLTLSAQTKLIATRRAELASRRMDGSFPAGSGTLEADAHFGSPIGAVSAGASTVTSLTPSTVSAMSPYPIRSSAGLESERERGASGTVRRSNADPSDSPPGPLPFEPTVCSEGPDDGGDSTITTSHFTSAGWDAGFGSLGRSPTEGESSLTSPTSNNDKPGVIHKSSRMVAPSPQQQDAAASSVRVNFTNASVLALAGDMPAPTGRSASPFAKARLRLAKMVKVRNRTGSDRLRRRARQIRFTANVDTAGVLVVAFSCLLIGLGVALELGAPTIKAGLVLWNFGQTLGMGLPIASYVKHVLLDTGVAFQQRASV